MWCRELICCWPEGALVRLEMAAGGGDDGFMLSSEETRLKQGCSTAGRYLPPDTGRPGCMNSYIVCRGEEVPGFGCEAQRLLVV